MVMVVSFGIQAATFTALNDDAVHIMVCHIDKEFGLAGAAAMRFVAAALTGRRSGGMLHDLCAFRLFAGKEDHIELGHVWSLSGT